MATEIDFVGYSEDCRVEGTLELDEPRLADLLNRRRSYLLRDVVVVSHLDGHAIQLDTLEVLRDELTAVVASGPRGDAERRVPTVSSGLRMKIGPYLADGHLHYARKRRPAMVAMTNARLSYQYCQRPVTERYPTLLVNRKYADTMLASAAV